MPFCFVSLFSGCGGLDLGFEQVGDYKTLWANDFKNLKAKKVSCALYKLYNLQKAFSSPSVSRKTSFFSLM